MADYAYNPKARFDYEILETFEAGLALGGNEVKSVRRGSASIKGVYVKLLGDEAWLLGANIPPYQTNNAGANYDPTRNRKLLLKKSEIKYLIGKASTQGLTLVPIRIYDKGGLIKLEIGVGRGKKKFDKRAAITKREVNRDISRRVKTLR